MKEIKVVEDWKFKRSKKERIGAGWPWVKGVWRMWFSIKLFLFLSLAKTLPVVFLTKLVIIKEVYYVTEFFAVDDLYIKKRTK